MWEFKHSDFPIGMLVRLKPCHPSECISTNAQGQLFNKRMDFRTLYKITGYDGTELFLKGFTSSFSYRAFISEEQ